MIQADTGKWQLIFGALALILSVGVVTAQESPSAVTATDPRISLEELGLFLKPLPKSQLLVEADAWQLLLQNKATEIAEKEVEIRRDNLRIAQAENIGEKALELQTAMEDADAPSTDVQDKLSQLGEAAAESAVAAAIGSIQDGATSSKEKSLLLENVAAIEAEEAKRDNELKIALLEQLSLLRDERTGLVDRLLAVLDELAIKTDETDADTLQTIRDLQLYAKAVSGIEINVKDATSAWSAVKGWLVSEEGGTRWGLNIATFLAILVAAWVVAWALSSGIRQALERVPGTSRLLENFLVKAVRWVIMAIGLIMALTALEVSIGPLLAVVGAAGFVIAFALQDSLSNFASGLMILFFRPFDEGDVIDAGGVSGKVQSMNLVSTTIQAFDNKRMVVPNNKIWNDVITNATGVAERRVDMEFGIGYDDDIDKAHAILVEIVTSHSKVLKEPEPVVRIHTLADSSVNFIVRPWARTADYWDIYWDVTRSVKQRFDAEGIGIPFPQRDVHLYVEGSGGEAVPTVVRQGESDTPREGQDTTVGSQTAD